MIRPQIRTSPYKTGTLQAVSRPEGHIHIFDISNRPFSPSPFSLLNLVRFPPPDLSRLDGASPESRLAVRWRVGHNITPQPNFSDPFEESF
jgi:hypothetical protein